MHLSQRQTFHDFLALYPPLVRRQDGVDVVFLHGFMGDHRDFTRLLAAGRGALAACNITLVDLPGHGASRLGPRPIDTAGCIALLGTALAAVGVHRPVYVGYSMGGRLAVALADQHTRGLFLESASFGIADPVARAARLARDTDLLGSFVALEDPSARETAFRSFLQEWYRAPLFSGMQDHPEFADLIALRSQNDPLQLHEALATLSLGNFSCMKDKVAHLDCPVTFVCGEQDAVYRASGRELALLPRVRVHEVAGCSHNVHWQHPAAYLDLLHAFLQAL